MWYKADYFNSLYLLYLHVTITGTNFVCIRNNQHLHYILDWNKKQEKQEFSI